MAPEIICGKGYNCIVDLWSIGICLYEFMCGMVPFGEEAEDPYEIYEEIIKKDITYPNYLKDKKAKKLMDQFIYIHFLNHFKLFIISKTSIKSA